LGRIGGHLDLLVQEGRAGQLAGLLEPAGAPLGVSMPSTRTRRPSDRSTVSPSMMSVTVRLGSAAATAATVGAVVAEPLSPAPSQPPAAPMTRVNAPTTGMAPVSGCA
jgi:hypothetical protein